MFERHAAKPFEYQQNLTDSLFLEFVGQKYEGASDLKFELEALFFKDVFMGEVRESETEWGEWKSKMGPEIEGYDAAQEHTYWDDDVLVFPVNEEVFWEFIPTTDINEETGEMSITVQIRRVREKLDERKRPIGEKEVMRNLEKRVVLRASPRMVKIARELIQRVERKKRVEERSQSLLSEFAKTYAGKKMTGREMLTALNGDEEAFEWITANGAREDDRVEVKETNDEWQILIFDANNRLDIIVRPKPEKA